MIQVTKFDLIDDHRIHLFFSDGTDGEVDLAEEMVHRPFDVLSKPHVWKAAQLDVGTVVWPDGIDFAPEYLYAKAHHLPAPRTYEDTLANEREVSLRDLRKLGEKTQVQMADSLKVSQPELSRLEGGGDFRLSTVRKYLAALGWQLEIAAVRGPARVKLRGF
jgi:hypothetical protein